MKFQFRKQRSSKAFTIVELLVVILIIEVLAAILYPVIAQAKQRAKSTSCSSNLRQIGMAMSMYESDDNEKFPFGIDVVDKYYPQMWSDHPDWQAQIPQMRFLSDLLKSYTRSAEIFKCPSDSGLQYLDTAFPLEFKASPSLFDAYRSSYFYRTEISFRTMSETDFQLPSQVGVLVDGAGFWHGSAPALESSDKGHPDSIMSKTDAYRYNILFGDFHVKSVDFLDYQKAWTVTLQP